MANYATLKSAIRQVIKTNGNEEITGALLQESLLSMIDSLGVGYQFIGIATPYTNPGTPDQNVFYIASTAGTYSNFGGIVLISGEVALLTYNGSWEKHYSGIASEEKLEQLEIASEEKLEQLEFEIEHIIADDGNDSNNDFRIADQEGRSVVKFSNGHIETKYFNSVTAVKSMTVLGKKLIVTI